MKHIPYAWTLVILFAVCAGTALGYQLVDTGQDACWDDMGNLVYPSPGEDWYGQDAQYQSMQMEYMDNGDGTVTDLNTGLTWQQIPSQESFSWSGAKAYCEDLVLAGYDDWRMPTLKELFSISDFSEGWPYLNTDYFDIAGQTVSKDEQFWCDSMYVGLTHEGAPSAFGVNHGTGHIKAYPAEVGGPMGNYVRAVRGDGYGENDFVDNGDGTVTDMATGLMWQQDDSVTGMIWFDALAYAENLETGGYTDWRLPDVKELQSIVDYTHSPNAIEPEDLGPAINTDFFNITPLPEDSTMYNPDYGYFWSGTSAYYSPEDTTHCMAWYVAFGTASGGEGDDIHGAGAVRYDYKSEDSPSVPGDPERIYNYVRCVRNTDMGVENEEGSQYTPSLSVTGANPITGTATLSLVLPSPGHVTLSIYDVSGRERARLVNSELTAGEHLINWNSSDSSTGVYFGVVATGDVMLSTRFAVVN